MSSIVVYHSCYWLPYSFHYTPLKWTATYNVVVPIRHSLLCPAAGSKWTAISMAALPPGGLKAWANPAPPGPSTQPQRRAERYPLHHSPRVFPRVRGPLLCLISTLRGVLTAARHTPHWLRHRRRVTRTRSVAASPAAAARTLNCARATLQVGAHTIGTGSASRFVQCAHSYTQ